MSTSNICGKGTQTQAAGVTGYYLIGQGSSGIVPTSEVNIQTTWRTAGTIRNLWYLVSANSLSGTATLRIRKNTANGNSVISVTAGATGAFEDTTNTDSIVAGDILNYSLVTAAGTGSITGALNSFLFAPGVGTLSRPLAGRGTGRDYPTASTVYFEALYSGLAAGITESERQQKFLLSGTLKNLFVRVITNGRGTTSTVRSRVSGANGTLTVSIGAAATGAFEDTSNSDAIVSGNLLNSSITTGTGTGSLIITAIAYDFVTTSNLIPSFSHGLTGAIGLSQTLYFPISGSFGGGTPELDFQLKYGIVCTLSNLSVLVITNTITATSTVRLRKNTANGNQIISITASTTGYFEDSTNSDIVIGTDLINIQLVTGGTGTSIIIASFGLKISTVSYARQVLVRQAVNRAGTY